MALSAAAARHFLPLVASTCGPITMLPFASWSPNAAPKATGSRNVMPGPVEASPVMPDWVVGVGGKGGGGGEYGGAGGSAATQALNI